MKSIWQGGTEFKKFPSLLDDEKTDVLIIGGGITGLLLAYELKKQNVNYILVEQGRVCNAVTSCTTAKITAQHGLIYNKIEKEFNLDFARQYLNANQSAVNRYRELANKFKCDFEDKNNYVYSIDDCDKLENEIHTLERIGFIADYVNTIPLPIKTVGAIRFEKQAQFNPLKLLSQLSRELNIYENTKVYAIENNVALTNGGRITADNIVVATHFPFINTHGTYFFKMYQSRSFVIGLDNGEDVNGMYVDEANGGMSFRNYGDYLLIGGYGRRTDGNCCFDNLKKFASIHYPQSKVEFQWATQDCMTLDGIPYIGKYSKLTHNLYVATGFNKWGMTSSMVAAKLLTDLLLNKENEFSEVFSPSRTMLRPQLLINSLEAVKNLCTVSGHRCTHMGCALKWNKEEHSWDCPCHGSRFAEDGSIIENPAVNKLRNSH